MKRCSTCNRTYTDPNLSFCIDDGTPLTTVETEDETTVVGPRGNQDHEWNAVAYRPPSSYVPPAAEVKPKRRLWPWIVGVAGAFILGILALSVAAVVLAPRLMRRDQRARSTINQPANSNTAENRNSNTAETSNANSNSTEHVDTPPSKDPEQVLTQLKELENEWTVANLNADRKKLDRILADDYVGQAGEDGGLETKAQYIESIERNTGVEKWELTDLKLTLAGDRATLSGIITYFLPDRTVSFDFMDKFVWRDGRWQATAAALKERGSSDSDL